MKDKKVIIEVKKVANDSYIVRMFIKNKQQKIEVAKILTGDGRYWGLPTKLIPAFLVVCFLRRNIVTDDIDYDDIEIVGEKIECIT